MFKVKLSGRVSRSCGALLLAASAVVSWQPKLHADEPYRIGIIASLTGAAAEYGDVLSKASIMAIEEINNGGGVNGRPIEYILEDGNCTANGAIKAYNKLVTADQVSVILGPSCSAELLGIAPLLERDKVLAFSSGTGADEITGISKFVFRNAAVNREAVKALAPVVHQRFGSVSMMTGVQDYTEGLSRGFTKLYTGLGGQILEDARYEPEATEFRTALTKVLAVNPPALVLNCVGEADCGSLMKQARELGYTGQIFGYDSLVITGALRIAGEAAEGSIASVAPYILPDNLEGQKVLAAFKEKHGYTSYEYYLAAAYDAPYILASCLEEVGNATDAEKLKNCMHAIKDYHGAAGTYGFDEFGDAAGITFFIVQVKNGEAVPLISP